MTKPQQDKQQDQGSPARDETDNGEKSRANNPAQLTRQERELQREQAEKLAAQRSSTHNREEVRRETKHQIGQPK